MLGAPGGAGSAHVVQFGPVGSDRVAGQFAPEAREDVAERGEGAGQQRDCGTRNSQYGATHDTAPTPTNGGQIRPLIPWSPVRRPGSWSVMMASKRLKTGTRTAYRRHFYNQPFQRFTDIADANGRQRLLFRVPPLHQPLISRQSVRQRVSARGRIRAAIAEVSSIDERSSIHLSHAGSDQDLPAGQEGAG